MSEDIIYSYGVTQKGRNIFKEYRANERIYAVNKSCWNERAGNSIRIVYVDTYPHGITDSLINSFLAGNNKSIINIRLSLNNFSDDQIPHGFDGMLIINKKMKRSRFLLFQWLVLITHIKINF